MPRNRVFALLLAFCIAFSLSAAAETSGDTLVANVRQSVLERSADQIVEISTGQSVTVENLGDFTVKDCVLTAADTPDEMVVAFYIDVRQSDDAQGNVAMSDYDFVLLSRNAEASAVDDLRLHMPRAVYEVGGRHFQELCWPVVLYPQETVSLLMEYVVPVDSLRLGLIATNMVSDVGSDCPVAVGAIYALSFSRNAADFNFFNRTEKDVAALYVCPENGAWSANLIAECGVPTLPAGKWMYVNVGEATAAGWSVKLTLTDGTVVNFKDIDLCGTFNLYFTEDEVTGYTVTAE